MVLWPDALAVWKHSLDLSHQQTRVAPFYVSSLTLLPNVTCSSNGNLHWPLITVFWDVYTPQLLLCCVLLIYSTSVLFWVICDWLHCECQATAAVKEFSSSSDKGEFTCMFYYVFCSQIIQCCTFTNVLCVNDTTTSNNNNNNNHHHHHHHHHHHEDDVMVLSSWESHCKGLHQMNVEKCWMATHLGCESACRLLSSTPQPPTIAIYTVNHKKVAEYFWS